ncbi:hypothetical protein ACJEDT_25655 (plasmid) [Rhodococcoides fascians]
MPSATFFPPLGLRGESRHQVEQSAKKLCAQEACRLHALNAVEP